MPYKKRQRSTVMTDTTPEPPKVVNIRHDLGLEYDDIQWSVDSFLVAALENALQKARAGQIKTFAGCGFDSDGNSFQVMGKVTADFYRLLGAITIMQAMIRDMVMWPASKGSSK